MNPDYRDLALGLACFGHLCWGALFLLFFVVSAFFSRRQPPIFPRRE